MTEQQARIEMRRISARLMRLANGNNGNAAALDAILEADAALQNYLRKESNK